VDETSSADISLAEVMTGPVTISPTYIKMTQQQKNKNIQISHSGKLHFY